MKWVCIKKIIFIKLKKFSIEFKVLVRANRLVKKFAINRLKQTILTDY